MFLIYIQAKYESYAIYNVKISEGGEAVMAIYLWTVLEIRFLSRENRLNYQDK